MEGDLEPRFVAMISRNGLFDAFDFIIINISNDDEYFGCYVDQSELSCGSEELFPLKFFLNFVCNSLNCMMRTSGKNIGSFYKKVFNNQTRDFKFKF